MIELVDITKRFAVSRYGRPRLLKTIASGVRIKGHSQVRMALDGINLKIEVPEVIGLIGPNGSGKSTLLRIIAGIYRPTSGDLKVDGGVTSVLQLGFGFVPDLTVQDNIFLIGAIMGLYRKEIKESFLDIVNFAGLKEFSNSEIRTLSLGMKERLAFSIVRRACRDILLLDEILVASDRGFKEKYLDVLEELKGRKKIIIICSHDFNMIRRLCSRVILLDQGRIAAFDRPGAVIDSYLKNNGF